MQYNDCSYFSTISVYFSALVPSFLKILHSSLSGKVHVDLQESPQLTTLVYLLQFKAVASEMYALYLCTAYII